MTISESNLKLLLSKLRDTVHEHKVELENSKDTWRKIGGGAKFAELGLSSEEELRKWILQNPYSSLLS